jgi:hypothetical protein
LYPDFAASVTLLRATAAATNFQKTIPGSHIANPLVQLFAIKAHKVSRRKLKYFSLTVSPGNDEAVGLVETCESTRGCAFMNYRWYDVRGAECFCFELAIRRAASRMRRSGLLRERTRSLDET